MTKERKAQPKPEGIAKAVHEGTREHAADRARQEADDRAASPPSAARTARRIESAAREVMIGAVKGRGGGADGADLIRRTAAALVRGAGDVDAGIGGTARGALIGAMDGGESTGIPRKAAAVAAATGAIEGAGDVGESAVEHVKAIMTEAIEDGDAPLDPDLFAEVGARREQITRAVLLVIEARTTQENHHMPFQCPKLPYDDDALEPVIDAETMRIHHDKHHQGYVDKLNKAVQGSQWEKLEIDELLRQLDKVDTGTRSAVRNNGGGHFNHSLFWKCLTPVKEAKDGPTGALAEAIEDAFGGFEEMKQQFGTAARGRFGSGWTWLCAQPDRRLHIVTTANQDTTLMPRSCGGLGSDHTPILGLDVWEHAYYLKHRNDRGAYVDGWWQIVNWDTVEQNFAATRETAATA